MNKLKVGKLLGISVLAASLLVTPSMAAPNINELEQSKKDTQSEVTSL